jgi:hypothetical protein
LPPRLGDEEIGKIKVVVSLAGTIRRCVVAEWMVQPKGLAARAVRSFLRSPLGKFPHLEGVESLTRDPWERLVANGRSIPGRFTWLSFAVFPDGDKGQPNIGALRGRLLRLLRGSSPVGPYDGLTESAASLLPPGTGLEQWIVRVRGSHGLVRGTYLDGTPVAHDRRRAAQQIIDPLLRALPAAVLSDRRAANSRQAR